MERIYTVMTRWRYPQAQAELNELPCADSLRGYLERGEHPGSFLFALMSNDFVRANRAADLDHQRAYGAIVAWLDAWAPPGTFGSAQKIDDYRTTVSHLIWAAEKGYAKGG